jgi:protein TonB
MFSSFDTNTEPANKRRWLASAGTSLAIWLGVGLAFVGVARSSVVQQVASEAIDVTFHRPPDPVAAPNVPDVPVPEIPAEAPKPAAKKPGPASSAKAGMAKPQVTPRSVPDARPEEGDGAAQAAEVDPDAFAEGGGEGTPVAPTTTPPAPQPQVAQEAPGAPRKDVVDLPDDAIVARPIAANAMPVYPDAERKKGIEGVVILRVVIGEAGDVVEVTVVRGEEPFASAAISAVRMWQYEAAKVAGRAVASARLIKIPFRIKT